jgi:hypothetical protein
MNVRFIFFVPLMAFLGVPTLTSAQESPAATAISVPTPTPTVDLATAPRVYVKKAKHHFGEVVEGPEITHNFRFYNNGASTLHIHNIGTSCGCTGAVLGGNNDIPPGESGIVKVTYHTQGRPGKATKTITITSNDPVNPNYTLEIDMTVVREVELLPERVFFSNVKKGTKQTATFKVLGRSEMPLKVLSAESANKVVSVTAIKPYTDKEQKRSGAEIELTLPESYPITAINDEIIVKTDNEKKPEVKAIVAGEVVGRVQCNPASLTFNQGQDYPNTVQFNVTDNPRDFVIRRVETKNKFVRPYVKKVPGPNGIDQYSMIVNVIKKIPQESDGEEEIIVYTNDNDIYAKDKKTGADLKRGVIVINVKIWK